jgi:Ca-activated chloride channel homolog
MKRLSWLLSITIFALVIYLFFSERDTGKSLITKAQQGGQSQQSTPVVSSPSAPPPVEKPVPFAEAITQSWPPARKGDESLPLANSLTRKNYVLILDGSGSMSKSQCSGNLSKNEVAKQAVIEWASMIPNDANLGLVVFDRSGFSIRLPLGLNNRENFRQEVGKVVPDYQTPLAMALDTAYSMLTEQGRKQLGYGEYTVVVVTDGAADDIKALERSVNMVLTSSPVMIYTIGFCIASDHSLNRQGRTIYRAANNPAELRQGLQDVLAESESFDISGFK